MCSGIASSPAHLHLLQVSYINKCTSCLKKEYVFCLKTIVLSISRFTFFGIIYQFLKDPGFELLGNNVEGLRNTYLASCYLLQIAVEFYHSLMCKHFYAFFLIIILHIFNIETETYEGNKNFQFKKRQPLYLGCLYVSRGIARENQFTNVLVVVWYLYKEAIGITLTSSKLRA